MSFDAHPPRSPQTVDPPADLSAMIVERAMAVYWCTLPVQLAFAWVDVSRRRAAAGTWRRVVAARRQLWLAPGSAVGYGAAFAAALALLTRVQGSDESQRVLVLACAAVLLVAGWRDALRLVDAWYDSGRSGWWHRLRTRVGAAATRLAPRPVFTA